MNLIKQYARDDKACGFSVVWRSQNGALKYLYEHINDIDEAYMLAQYAMDHDRPKDTNGIHRGLIIIMPGFNRSIKDSEVHYKIAQRLAQKYKAD